MKQILYLALLALLLTGCFLACSRSKDCEIQRISQEDKEWMIPMESFATVGFTGDQNHHELFRSQTGSRDFTDCSGWFGSGRKYEIIEKEFDKDSCTSPRCHMKMKITRNAEDKHATIVFDFLDFSCSIPHDQEKKAAQSLYVPALKTGVLTWTFKNRKAGAEVSAIQYSKQYGLVGYEKNTGEKFVMDTVYSRPYFPL